MNPDLPILCLDYGRKRIGVAISHGVIAEPLVVLTNDESLSAQLALLVTEHTVATLLLGISDGAMAQESYQFGVQLGQSLNLPVKFADETLTSQVAEQKYTSVRIVGRSKTALDHFAAAEILQQWLDENA